MKPLLALLLAVVCLSCNPFIHAPHDVDVDEDGDVDLADWACLQNGESGLTLADYNWDYNSWMGGPGVDALAYRFAGRIVTVCCEGECWDLDFRE